MFGNVNKKSIGPFIGMDLAFIAFAIIAVLLSWRHAREGAAAVSPVAEVAVFVGAVLVGIVLLSVLATFTLQMDRKLNDEYVFQAMANSAISAILIAFVADLALEIFARDRFESSSDLTLAILAGSWATGYGIYRIRGTVL